MEEYTGVLEITHGEEFDMPYERVTRKSKMPFSFSTAGDYTPVLAKVVKASLIDSRYQPTGNGRLEAKVVRLAKEGTNLDVKTLPRYVIDDPITLRVERANKESISESYQSDI